MSIIINIFAALADPTRLRIMTLLRSMELSVGELAQVLGQSQPRVSRHLKILADAGLVDRRKEGAWTFVALGREQRVKPALAAIDLWGADETESPWTVADAAGPAAVRADRAAAERESGVEGQSVLARGDVGGAQIIKKTRRRAHKNRKKLLD